MQSCLSRECASSETQGQIVGMGKDFMGEIGTGESLQGAR